METRWVQLILTLVWRLMVTSGLGNGNETSDVALLVKMDTENIYKSVICLASGNRTTSAIAWTAPLTKFMVDPVVEVKGKVNSPLDCDFSQKSTCDTSKWSMGSWSIINSFDYGFLIEPLTDYRWEGLEEIRTSSPNRVTRKLVHLRQSWEMGFSVRSNHDAHIQLSDGPNPEQSSTLWIILGGWNVANTQRSVIRWCNEGVPPADKFPDGECKNGRSDYAGKFLSEYKWLHLKLSWDYSLTRLSVWRLGDKKPVLSSRNDYHFSPTHISLESRHGSTALWRLHKYYFLGGNNSDLESPWFVPRRFPVEMVMLYAIIPPCTPSDVQVSLLHMTSDPVDMKPMEDLVADGTWREARFIGIPQWQPEEPLSVRITAASKNDVLIGSISEGKYFNGHLRMMEMTSWADWTPACQILQTDVVLSRTAAWASSGCPADYFMSDCSLKCSDILGMENDMCYGVTICRDIDGNPVCSCSPGHQGTYCHQECPSNKFGDRCRETCRRCKGTCDRFTGACPEGCEVGYIEPDCEKTYPIMAEYPNVTATTNEINVTIETMNYNGEGVPAYFDIEVESVNNMELVQVNRGVVGLLDTKKSWVFRNLKPGKWYRVRVVLYVASHHTYNGPLVPFTEVRLKCNAPRNITTTASKTSVLIEWQEDYDTCPGQFLEYQLNGTVVARTGKESQQRVELSGLEPFTEYELLVRPSKEELLGLETIANFTTAQDAPSEVTDLKVEKASAKSLFVTWARPNDVPGILQRYLVTYSHDGFRECPRENSLYVNSVSVNSTKSDILLENLQSYSAYNICVIAETAEPGPSVCVLGLTTPAGKPEEGPVALTQEEGCELSSTEALLRWTQPDACRGRGPVTSFLVTVSDNDARTVVLSTTTTKPEVRVAGLRAGAWYDASVVAVRLLPNHDKELHLAFRTPTGDAGDGVFFVASQRHPYNLKMSNVSHDSISISWEKANNYTKVQTFSLEVSESISYLLFPHVKKESKMFVTYNDKKTEFFYTVKDLLPSTVYCVTVRGVGESEEQSSILQLQTSMKDARINEDLVVDSVTTTTATLIIPPADQFVTKYSAYFVIVSSPDLRSDGDMRWSELPFNIRSEVAKAANISSNSLHWLAAELTPLNATSYFVVGGSSKSTQSLYTNGSRNVPLRQGRRHVLTLVLLNAVDWETRVVAISVGVMTLSDLQLAWLALLLLLPLGGYAIWMFRRGSFFTSHQFSRSSRSDTDAYSSIQEDE